MPMPKPPCGTDAVAPQVHVPVEGFFRQLMLFDPFQQQIEVVEALSAADDLAVPFRREDVDAERQLRPLRDPASCRTP